MCVRGREVTLGPASPRADRNNNHLKVACSSDSGIYQLGAVISKLFSQRRQRTVDSFGSCDKCGSGKQLCVVC